VKPGGWARFQKRRLNAFTFQSALAGSESQTLFTSAYVVSRQQSVQTERGHYQSVQL